MPNVRKPRRNRDGSWSVSVRFYDAAQVPDNRTVTIKANTKSEAMGQVSDMLSQYSSGYWHPWQAEEASHNPTTFIAAVNAYIAEAEKQWSDNTRNLVKPFLRRVANSYVAGTKLSEITADSLLSKIDHGNSPHTIERQAGRINTMFTWFHHQNLISKPIRIKVRKRHTEEQLKYITWQELQQVKKCIASEARAAVKRPHVGVSNTSLWLIRFLDFMFLFGLRRQEALDVRLSDIDFEYNNLLIRNTKGRRHDVIPFSPDSPAHKVLKRQIFALKRRGINHPTARLFQHSGGHRISKTFKRYVRMSLPAHRARVIKLHSVRHGTATYLLQHMSLNEVKDYMRHKDIRTTLRYAKVIKKELRAAAESAFSTLNRQNSAKT